MTAYSYQQSSGRLVRPSDGAVLGVGYSGFPPYVNVPDAQNLKGKGPIPRGLWKVIGFATDTETGPHSWILEPAEGTEVFDRDGFRMHGEKVSGPPGQASHGCIIMQLSVRLMLAPGDIILVIA